MARRKYDPRRETVRNLYDCPTRIWRKLDFQGRIAYNSCLETGSAADFVPFSDKLTDAEWSVLDHNFAVYTAFLADKMMRVS